MNPKYLLFNPKSYILLKFLFEAIKFIPSLFMLLSKTVKNGIASNKSKINHPVK